jgi:cytochrome c5
MKFSQTFTVLSVGALLVLSSCKHPIPEPEPMPCEPGLVYFQEQILPLLKSNCAMPDCHKGPYGQDGIVLDSYESIMASGIVNAGNADDSDLYDVLVDSDPDDRMPPPPNAPLSALQIQLIKDWINQGAMNTTCPDNECNMENITFSGTIDPILSTFCKGCHGSVNPNAGVQLLTYSQVKAVADDGRLHGVLSPGSGYSSMPPNGSLTPCKIDQIKAWIEAGAPNN